MERYRASRLALAATLCGGIVVGNARDTAGVQSVYGGLTEWRDYMEFEHPEGRVAIATSGDPVSMQDHPFFQTLGGNGRTCLTCHNPADAMSLSLRTIQQRWAEQGHRDPLFHPIDGANCPTATPEQEASHSLLLERGLIRISLPWPPRDLNGKPIEPEFTLEVVQDPTGCNSDRTYGIASANPHVSVYRRPRMTANLRYIVKPIAERNTKTMMPLDRDPETGERVGMALLSDSRFPTLKLQAIDAIQKHLQAPVPSNDVVERLVDFQLRVYAAAQYSRQGGRLDEPGAPPALGVRAMQYGKSQVNGNDIDTGVFFKFDQWKPKAGSNSSSDEQTTFRASVARGYDLFFLKPFWISNAVGINNVGLGNPLKQTCAFCHNTQLTGHDNVPGWMDIGTTNFPYVPADPALPLFKITCRPEVDPHPYLGREIYTQDPGRALVSGKCFDVGSIVMQQFRGIAARAPYFVNGSAQSLRELVDFYDRRFNIGYTEREKQDLINFLSVL